MSEKSGAASPTCKLPARAWVHNVSNGRTRNATDPGTRAITHANASGDCRITANKEAQAIVHNKASAPNIESHTRRADLRFVSFVFKKAVSDNVM